VKTFLILLLLVAVGAGGWFGGRSYERSVTPVVEKIIEKPKVESEKATSQWALAKSQIDVLDLFDADKQMDEKSVNLYTDAQRIASARRCSLNPDSQGNFAAFRSSSIRSSISPGGKDIAAAVRSMMA
jgi:hypothetical protein